MRIALLLALTAVLAPAAAQGLKDMPSRKPGLWEIKLSSAELPKPMLTQQCIDAHTDNLMQQMGESSAQQQCSKNTVRREGGKVIVESVCKVGHSTATTQAVFSGDFSVAYRGDIHSTYAPPLSGMKESRQTIEARWLGACKPGQKPGDIVMPGMGSMNINELMRSMPKQ